MKMMKDAVLTDYLKKSQSAKYLSDDEMELFYNLRVLIEAEKKLDALSIIIEKYIKFKDNYVACYHNDIQKDGYYEVKCNVPDILCRKINQLGMKVQEEKAKKLQEANDKKELKSKAVQELYDALSQ